MRYALAVLLILGLFSTSVLGGETVLVGAYNNPPKIFFTPDGNISGIFPDVLADIAKVYDWDVSYVTGTWQECLERLQRGEIDLMVDVAFSEDRLKLYDFSKEPVLVNWGTAYCRADRPIKSFLDMENKTVAVMRGSIHTDGRQGIKALMTQFDVPCRYIEVDSYHEVLMLLDSKQADIGIVNRLYGTLHADGFDVLPTPIIFNPRKLLFCTSKGSELGALLLEQIDDRLRQVKKKSDSVYNRALGYYLGGGAREGISEAQPYSLPLSLTSDEVNWIAEHPQIRFSVDPKFAPFEYLSAENQYSGISADFLKLIGQKTGLSFQLVRHSNWSESVQAVKNHDIDLLPCVGDSHERQQFLSFTDPYVKFARIIVTGSDSTVQHLEDLQALRVAVQADSSHHAFLKEHTTIVPRLYETYEACLLAVSSGDMDATIGNMAVTTHQMRLLSLTNIKMAAYAASQPQPLSLGVRKDWPQLTSILNKALQSVSMKQHNAILSKWLPLPVSVPNVIDLSQKEREWLLMHPRVQVAWDRSWAPVEFADADGKPQGVSMEYLAALEGILGIRFDAMPATDWQQAYERLKNHDIDMSACLALTAERLDHFAFTEPYLSLPVVFFARGYAPYIRGFFDLKNSRVVVVKGYATDEWISRDYPELNIVRVATIADAFNMLRQDDADVFIGCVVAGTYYLNKHQFHDIKIAGETSYTYKLRMAVRNDWSVFAGILQKALDSLTEKEKGDFFNKWVTVKYEHKFDYSLLIKIILGALVVFLVFFYWNRRLSSEVARRKQAQKALMESEEALRTSYAELSKLEEMKENLTHMIVHDMRSPLATIIGSLDLLLLEYPITSLGDDGSAKLLMAKVSALELTNMAQALLDISRLEQGLMPINQVQMDMAAVAAEAISAMEIQAQLAGVRLVQTGEAASGKADPDIIHRVIVNLIGNAIKASPNGETVEIRTMNNHSQMAVEVRDNGHGIPKRFQSSLFDKFSSAEVDRANKGSVGLGLAFCKLAVEAHGGGIEVESDEGRGSIFRFKIVKTNP